MRMLSLLRSVIGKDINFKGRPGGGNKGNFESDQRKMYICTCDGVCVYV